MKILVINGPNLNLLGSREPEKYGNVNLSDIEKSLLNQSLDLAIEISFFQSNIEGEIINAIHKSKTDKVDFIIINPAAYTHTSVAIRDALLAVNTKFIEIHLSNIYQREKFRHHSYFSDIAVGVISGFGALGYNLALHAAHQNITKNL